MVVTLLAGNLRHWPLAGAHRLAIDMDRAGAAQARAAAEFRARQLEMLAHHPQQRGTRGQPRRSPLFH